MTRRRYPILGRLNVPILEVNITALKPVYLRFRILEVDLRASLRVLGAGPEAGPWSWS